MPDDPYSLGDLARLAGVTPRTVRYYVAQGLLPSPEAAGPATHYGEGHLARLRLIRRLQRGHLPLAGIRGRMERMDDAAVTAALDLSEPGEPDVSSEPGDTLAYVRDLMARAGVASSTMQSAMPSAMASTMPSATSGAMPSPPMPSPAMPAQSRPLMRSLAFALDVSSPPADAARPATLPGGDRSTWERLAITPDVEIHVRRPLDRQSNKRVEQLARMARELFEEGS